MSLNWATSFFGYNPNMFQLSYDVFNPNGTVRTDSLLSLSVPVNQGDTVLLNI